eukprot:CAMPEP_0194347474 /NCGR_PEP_ID=MMETSP0171-20130528/106009_1 /TAXON_ID=218684 /ORGANISM="Corethron pennatum, Strain L29A3" /LENGTH=77 /DNA_ID=CAMNT_0039114731 /DNA_START=1106 /DNA_END=1339 /DNA_ORIENTATION=+
MARVGHAKVPDQRHRRQQHALAPKERFGRHAGAEEPLRNRREESGADDAAKQCFVILLEGGGPVLGREQEPPAETVV